MNEDIDDVFPNDGEMPMPPIIHPLQNNVPRVFQATLAYFGCCCLYFFLLIAAILITILLIIHFTNEPSEFLTAAGVAAYSTQNINTAPLQSIQIISANSICPDGYSLLQLAEWLGTESGCYCPITGSLDMGACNLIEEIVCNTINPVAISNLISWKGSNFCVTRTKNYQFIFGGCPTGYIQCSQNICIPINNGNSKCPVTKIMIVSNNDTKFGNRKQDENDGYTVEEMEDGQLLLYKNEKNTPPINNLDISVNGLPCLSLDNEPVNYQNPYSDYPLKTYKAKGCGKYGPDYSSAVIDYDTEEDLLNANGIINTTSQLPLFQSSIQGNFALLTIRPRLQINQNHDCFNINFLQYANIDENLYAIYNTISVIALISVLLLCCVTFFAIGLAFLFFLTGMAEEVPRALVKSPLPFIIGFILSALFIGGVIVITNNRDSINNSIPTSKAIYQNKCFENPFINMAFLDLSYGLPNSISANITIIESMMWFTIIISLLLSAIWLGLRG